jgi:hypothetical protein
VKRRAGRSKSGPKSISRRNRKHQATENTHHVPPASAEHPPAPPPAALAKLCALFKSDRLLAWTDSKRVACDEYFIRYLAAVIPESDVPDAEVGQWKNDAGDEDSHALAAKL